MRFWELCKRNLKENYRDPMGMAFLLGFPLVFMLLFGSMFGGDTVPNYPIGVIDEDNTTLSQTFVTEALAELPTIEVISYEDNTTAWTDLELGDIKGLDDLKKLPFTEKHEIRESLGAAPPLGKHGAVDIGKVIRVYSTSGTTGNPTLQLNMKIMNPRSEF